ncbi:MAG: hypothetical protein R6T99_00420 [Bacteroidales bacterium]
MKATFFSILSGLIMILTAGPVNAQVESDSQASGIPKYGEDSVQCIMNLSLYNEFYKQWKNSQYKNASVRDAIGPWRYVFMHCPLARQSIYINGVKIMEWRIKNAENETARNRLIDTLMMVYDKRIKFFNKEGYVLGRKGVSLYKYHPEEYEEIHRILNRSVELEGRNSYPDVLVFFIRATKKMIDEGDAPVDIMFENYEIASNIIEYKLEAYQDDKRRHANWENVKGNIEKTFEPYATCDALIEIYGKKFRENPEDTDLLKKIIRTLDKKNCTEDQLYFDATLRLYELEPTPESAYLIGRMMMKEKKYTEAVKYLKEGEKLDDIEDVAKSYLLLAEAYDQMKNYPMARNYALKAAKADPEDGHPYLQIGDMYAASASDCGDDELEKKSVYWAAVDKFYQAKRVDPDLAEIANNRIATYKNYFPSQETIFFHDLNEGDEYLVECWINEKTTVRAASSN